MLAIRCSGQCTRGGGHTHIFRADAETKLANVIKNADETTAIAKELTTENGELNVP